MLRFQYFGAPPLAAEFGAIGTLRAPCQLLLENRSDDHVTIKAAFAPDLRPEPMRRRTKFFEFGQLFHRNGLSRFAVARFAIARFAVG